MTLILMPQPKSYSRPPVICRFLPKSIHSRTKEKGNKIKEKNVIKGFGTQFDSKVAVSNKILLSNFKRTRRKIRKQMNSSQMSSTDCPLTRAYCICCRNLREDVTKSMTRTSSGRRFLFSYWEFKLGLRKFIWIHLKLLLWHHKKTDICQGWTKCSIRKTTI